MNQQPWKRRVIFETFDHAKSVRLTYYKGTTRLQVLKEACFELFDDESLAETVKVMDEDGFQVVFDPELIPDSCLFLLVHQSVHAPRKNVATSTTNTPPVLDTPHTPTTPLLQPNFPPALSDPEPVTPTTSPPLVQNTPTSTNGVAPNPIVTPQSTPGNSSTLVPTLGTQFPGSMSPLPKQEKLDGTTNIQLRWKMDGKHGLKSFLVSELKSELAKLGLNQKGLKNDLLDRLDDFYMSQKSKPATHLPTRYSPTATHAGTPNATLTTTPISTPTVAPSTTSAPPSTMPTISSPIVKDTILVTVVDASKLSIPFNLKLNIALRALMNTYCRTLGIEPTTSKFLYKGVKIQETDTAEKLCMTDGAVILVETNP